MDSISVREAVGPDFGLRIDADAPTVQTFVLGEVREARLAVADRIDVGGASARAVEVAVVPELAPGMDGIVGMSFLMRFAVETDDDGVHFSAADCRKRRLGHQFAIWR